MEDVGGGSSLPETPTIERKPFAALGVCQVGATGSCMPRCCSRWLTQLFGVGSGRSSARPVRSWAGPPPPRFRCDASLRLASLRRVWRAGGSHLLGGCSLRRFRLLSATVRAAGTDMVLTWRCLGAPRRPKPCLTQWPAGTSSDWLRPARARCDPAYRLPRRTSEESPTNLLASPLLLFSLLLSSSSPPCFSSSPLLLLAPPRLLVSSSPPVGPLSGSHSGGEESTAVKPFHCLSLCSHRLLTAFSLQTAAFGLPILQRLMDAPQGLYALILAPTR